MPISIPYTWSQTDTTVTIVYTLPTVALVHPLTPHSLNLLITATHIKLSHPPALSLLDLLHPIDPSHSSHSLSPPNTITLTLHKSPSSSPSPLWPSLLYSSPSKAALHARRQLALTQHDADTRATAASATARKAEERREEKERGWATAKAQKEAIATLKARERVVAVSELQAWEEKVKRPQVWRAETGEMIEVMEEEGEGEGEGEGVEGKGRGEEGEEKTVEEEDEVKRPPPTARALPPVRAGGRVTATFTAVHPTLPSLPARNTSLPSPPSSTTLPSPPHPLLPQLLPLKSRADAFYTRRDLPSALAAYTAVLSLAPFPPPTPPGEVGRVVALTYCNRSACHWAMKGKGGKVWVAGVRGAEADAREGLRLLAMVEGVDGAVLDKTRRRLVEALTAQGKWAELVQLGAANADVHAKAVAVAGGGGGGGDASKGGHLPA